MDHMLNAHNLQTLVYAEAQ